MSAFDAVPPTPILPGSAEEAKLDALRRSSDTAAARKTAAGELQTLFLTQLLRAMRRTIPENDFLPKSPARKMYEDAFDETVARTLGQGDPLGMVEQMSPKVPARNGR